MDRTLLTTLLAYTFALALIFLLCSILSPFMAELVWAGAIGIITYPFYEQLLKRCRGREIAAALLMTTGVVLAVILPLTGLVFALAHEAKLAYQFLENISAGGSAVALGNFLQHPAILPWLERLKPLTGTLNTELDAMLLPVIKQGISYLLNYSTGILKDSFSFLINLVLMVITLFFIYKDGQSFMVRFWKVAAIDGHLKTTIIETITRILVAVMYGIVLTCLVQGTLGGIGFWVAGLPSPLLFGTLMVICALIPVVGTALIWLPGAIYLLANGQTLPGLGLIVWGVLAVSSIDNIIRPLFISGKARLPMLVITLGVLGGFLAFGLMGVVAGPVILALAIVLFESYGKESVAVEAEAGAPK